MASIYDEINQIKREGSTYDYTPIDPSSYRVGTIKDLEKTVRDTSLETFYNTPHYVGKGYGLEDFGNSQYDRDYMTSMADVEGGSLSNLRASRQTWYDQIGNNLANMGVIATTTFADSFIGTAAGLVNMVFNPHDTEKTKLNWGERQLDKFVNNPVSLWLNSINKSVKESLPTYHTDEYEQNQAEGKWWKNMGSSAFWGETIMENAGFTLGMVASGKVSGSLLGKAANMSKQTNIIRNSVDKAIKAGKIEGTTDDIVKKILAGKQSLDGLDMTGEIAKAVKNINQASSLNRSISTAIAVTGEARQEGINSSQEYREQQLMNLDSMEGQQELFQKTLLDLFSKNPDMFNYSPLEGDPLQSIKGEYLDVVNQAVADNREKAIVEVNDAASRVAGMDFALNFPILYGSTMWQFGRTFSKGYDTQKGFLNNLRGAARQPVNGIELEGANRIVREGGKYAVSNTTKDKILRGLKIASNPIVEANEEMVQASAQTASERWAGAKMNSFLGYQLDPESEQQQIGKLNAIWNGIIDTYSDPAKYQEGFAGLIMGGMGSLNFTFSKNAQGNTPIFEGGIWQDIRDAKQENQDLQAAADALNNRLQSPEFLNYYQGLIRHDALENNKLEALQNEDKFSFMNNDHAQLISDIIMFEKAGKIQDLYDNLDANIDKFSTTDKAQVAEIASELRELSKNQETGKDMLADKTDDEIVKESLKFNQKLKDSVDNYRTISNNLKSLIGNKFLEDKEFHEMTYLFSQIDNFEGRYKDIQSNLVEKLNNIKTRGLRNKLFDIKLDNQEKRLTFDELISELSPEQLREYIFGKQEDILGEAQVGNDYLQNILKTEANREVATKYILQLSENAISKEIDKIDKLLNRKNASKPKSAERKKQLKEFKKNLNKIQKELEVLTPNAHEIMKDFTDLVKVENARFDLVNTYNKFINEPHLLKQHLADEEQKAAKGQDEVINRTVKDDLREAQSIADIRDIVSKETNDKGNKSIDRILAEMSISDNQDYAPLVAEYRQIENLGNEVNDSEIAKRTSSDIMDGVNQLYDTIKNRARSYEDLTNPVITQEDLGELGDRNNLYPQDMREEIKNTLLDILHEIKDRNNKYNNISNKLTPAPKKEETRVEPEVSEKPISNVSTKQIEADNNNIRKDIDTKNNKALVDKAWNNGTFEIDIDVYNASGRIQDQANPLYAPAVNYLKENGAFEYINSGKLNRGDKVKFLAHTPYWDYLKENGSNEEWVNTNKPLLLVVEDKNGTIESEGKKYQVVGTFERSLNEVLHKEIINPLNSISKSNIPIPAIRARNNEPEIYLSGKSNASFNLEGDKENSFFGVENIKGDEADFIFHGNAKEAIAKRIFSEDIAITEGSPINSTDLIITKLGKAKKINGKWKVITPIQVSFISDTTITDTSNNNNSVKDSVYTTKLPTKYLEAPVNGMLSDYTSSDSFKSSYSIYQIEDNGNLSFPKDTKTQKLSIAHKESMILPYFSIISEDLNPNNIEVIKPASLSLHNGNWMLSSKGEVRLVDSNSDKVNGTNKTSLKSSNNPVLKLSTISTTVVNITPGRLEFNTDKLLSSLQGKTPWGEDIEMLFGIATDTGQLETNLDATDFGVFNVTSTNTDYSNSGRLYLLTKSATGDYIPTAVRAKTLNEVDFGKDTPLFNELRRSVQEVAKSAITNNEEAVSNAVHDLRNILYVGSKAGLSINLRSEPFGNRTEFNLVLTKKDGSTEIVNVGHSELREIDSEKFSDNGIETVYNFNTEEQVTNNLMNALSKMKAPFQINKNNINGKWNVRQSLDYNKVLIDSDILTTNLSNNYVRGAYFVMNPLDNNLAEVHNTNTAISEKNATPATQTVTQGTNNTFGTEVNTEIGSFLLNNKGEVTTVRGIPVIDGRMVATVKAKNYLDGLSKDDLDNITYYGKDFTANDGVFFSAEKYYLFPSGAVFTGKDIFPPSSPQAKAVERLKRDKVKPEVKPEFTQEDATSVPFNQEDDAYSGTIEEVPFFSNTTEQGNTEATPPSPQRERKRPSRNLALNQDISETTKEDIEKKIQENKDFQKDNCNGIAPV